MNEREKQIEKFLKKWDKMLKAANEIDGFKWQFGVTISSDNALISEREKVIDGINRSFEHHNMTWSSNK